MLDNLYWLAVGKFGVFAASFTGDPFEQLGKSSSVNGMSKIKDVGASWYVLCQLIGASGFLVTGTWAIIKISASRNANGRAESKQAFTHKLLVCVLLSGLAFLIGTIVSVANWLAS